MPNVADDDAWMKLHLRSIGVQRLHAIGVIALRWNLCEYALFSLFCEVAQVSEQKGWLLVHNLKDESIVERIDALAVLREFGSDAKDLIANSTTYYERCRRNRNAVMHAWTRRVNGELLLARKSKKIDRLDVEPFASALPDLRRVAEEMETISRRLFALEQLLHDNGVSQPIPSLDKLTPPKLLWSTPPQAQTA